MNYKINMTSSFNSFPSQNIHAETERLINNTGNVIIIFNLSKTKRHLESVSIPLFLSELNSSLRTCINSNKKIVNWNVMFSSFALMKNIDENLIISNGTDENDFDQNIVDIMNKYDVVSLLKKIDKDANYFGRLT